MFALLLGAGVLYVALGDLREAVALLAFASLSVIIAIVQEGRSERVLEALRDLSSPRALVIRDGQRVRIPGREVVRGDLLILGEGDRVPADGLLLEGESLLIDESLLTGESVPVRKRPSRGSFQLPGAPVPAVPEGDDGSHLFSGTLIVRGTGTASATFTGARTEIGKIGRAVGAIEREQPRLQQQTRKLVYFFAAVGLGLSALVVVLYAALRGSWIEALLAGTALGMSMLPEEFPLVLTVFMVMGAWRLSRVRVLTRRAAAIEALGAATVLCSDKTGTLTRNVMTVCRLQNAGGEWRPEVGSAAIAGSGQWQLLLRCAQLASDGRGLDPMDRAVFELASSAATRVDWTTVELVREYPLSSRLLAVTRVWRSDETLTAAAKGAPEAIAGLCRLTTSERASMKLQVDGLAAQGLRVLGVARALSFIEPAPTDPGDLLFEYVGLVAFADPLREGVPAAVREYRAAGIRVIMITGDYPQTAAAIARQAGIDAGDPLTGAAVESLSDAALAMRVRTSNLFARITPAQKLRIVNALKANGEIVAMTGDGVNDAPALKAAHIGVAMGGRGTDVAREAAAIVLLDDDFGSIVRAVRLGRRINDNLRKAIGYILAIHVPIAGLALLPLFLGLPLLLTPMLIAFLELIIDPACSIAFEAEPEEADLMQRPPRSPQAPLISRRLISWSLLQGLLGLAATLTVVLVSSSRGVEEAQMRTLSLVTLVGVNLTLIFVNRSFSASWRAAFGRPNPWLWTGVSLAVGVLCLMLGWSDARQFLDLGELDLEGLALSLVVIMVLFIALERMKRLHRLPQTAAFS